MSEQTLGRQMGGDDDCDIGVGVPLDPILNAQSANSPGVVTFSHVFIEAEISYLVEQSQ